MPICQNCYNKWSWQETFKKSFTLGTSMTCPYCNATQYVTAHVRKRSTTITLIIIPLIMLGNLVLGPSYIALFALIGLLPLFFIIYPFFVQLSNEEEPLF